MAEIRLEKRGKYWQYRFETAKVNGKRNTISKSGFKTKAQAAAAGAQAQTEYTNAGMKFEPSEISVSDFYDLWMEDYCLVNLKKTTITNYKKKIKNYICPIIGKYKLKALTPSVMQNLVNTKAKENYSRNTLVVIKGILTRSMNYAVMHRLILHSPMQGVSLPKPRNEAIKPRTKPHVFILPKQIEAIFKRFPEKTSDHIPMMFGYKGGMRISEAFAVFWEDVHFDENKVSVNRQVQWDESLKVWYFSDPKYDSFRKLEMDKTLMDLLQRERLRQKKARLYYAQHYIRLYEDEYRRINTEGKGKEIFLVNVRENGSFISPRTMQHTSFIIHSHLDFPKFDFHSFRNTHASMLAERNVPPNYLKNRMGHKNLEVTMRYYLHLTDGMAKAGTKIVEDMFQR